MQLSDFIYNLPKEAIAQAPISPRDHSKLLCMNGAGEIKDASFYDLPDILQEGDLLVLNNSRVVKSRLLYKSSEKKIELFLNKPTDKGWHAFAKPARKVAIGDEFTFGPHVLQVIDKGEMGQIELSFKLDGDSNIFTFLEQYGQMPLPPYIKREEQDARQGIDAVRYQTVYSQPEGSVAAPTAGLHFTDEILQKLRRRNVQIEYVTLHVGAGTFLPVKVENLEEHKMHSEFCEIPNATANAVNSALEDGRRVIAVGTTSLRTLESAAQRNLPLIADAFETDLFISPGFEFNIVNGLITNFHLPKATPLMLTCAFGGYNKVMAAYNHALSSNYRFCSYGDSCFFLRDNKNEI